MTKHILFIYSLLLSTATWALPLIPTEFEIVREKSRLRYSCSNQGDPVGNFSAIEKIDNFMDCNKKTIKGYCGCINKKFEGKPITEEEQKVLEVEIGYFGLGIDPYLQNLARNNSQMQALRMTYDKDKQAGCMDIDLKDPSARNGESYRKVLDQNNANLASLRKKNGEVPHNKVPGYVSSKYIDIARSSQNVMLKTVMSEKTLNRIKSEDISFLTELAKKIAKIDPKLLQNDSGYRDTILAKDGEKHRDSDEYLDIVDNRKLLPWQSEVKKFVTNDLTQMDSNRFSRSPLFNSMKETLTSFGEDEKGLFPLSKQDFLGDLIDATRSLGLTSDEIEKLADGQNVDLSDIEERLKNKEENTLDQHLASLAKDMCAANTEILLHEVITGEEEMSEFNQNRYEIQGKNLLSKMMGAGRESVAGIQALRDLGETQNTVFSAMIEQFENPLGPSSIKSGNLEQEINDYIRSRKDLMGRLFCVKNFAYEQANPLSKAIAADEEASQALLAAKRTMDSLEARNDELMEKTKVIDNALFRVRQNIQDIGWELLDLKEQDGLTVIKLKDATGPDEIEKFKEELRVRHQEISDLEKQLEERKGHEKALLVEKDSLEAEGRKLADEAEATLDSYAGGKGKKTLDSVLSSDENTGSDLNNQGRNPVTAVTGAPQNSTSGPAHFFRGGKPVLTGQMMTQELLYLADVAVGNSDLPETSEFEIPEGTTVVPGPVGPNGEIPYVLNIPEAPNGTVIAESSFISIRVSDLGAKESLSIDPETGEVRKITERELAEESSVIAAKTLGDFEEILKNDLVEGTPPSVLDDIREVASDLANRTYMGLKSSDADIAVTESFTSAVENFDRNNSPKLGEMNFVALGEYNPPKSISSIIESSTASILREPVIKTPALKTPKVAPVVNRPIAQITFQPPVRNVLRKENLVTAPAIVKKPVVAPKGMTEFELNKIAEDRAKAIIQARKAKIKTEKKALAKDIPVKTVKRKSAEIERLEREIAREKEANVKLDRELVASELQPTGQVSVLPVSKTPTVADLPQIGRVPSAVVSKPSTKSGSSSVSRKKSFGGGSIGGGVKGAASVASSSAVEGRVNGGVIVNGEFIPNALLSSTATKEAPKVASSDLTLKSSSSYNLKPVASDTTVDGIPFIKSEKFTGLTEEEKEKFIQKELTRLKTEQLVIEVQDGTNLLVKSTVSLRTRMKVSDLNALFEEADE